MFIGCDPERLREAAAELEHGAAELDARAASTAAGFATVPWHGPDADRARDEAHSRLVEPLRVLAIRARGCAQTLRADAEEQDAVSAPDGGGAMPVPTGAFGAATAGGIAHLASTARSAAGAGAGADPSGDGDLARAMRHGMPVHVEPSRGLFGDLAGPGAEELWLDASDHAAKASMKPGGASAVEAIVADTIGVAHADYEIAQGVDEGDPFRVADGLVERRLASADALFNALELTPAAPIGMVGSGITGGLLQGWNDLRRDALADEAGGGEGEGSVARYVLQTPRRIDEDVVQPWAQRTGGPLGEAVGTVSAGVADGEERFEEAMDRGTSRIRSRLSDIPGADSVLAAPRTAVEMPRRVLGEVFGG